MSKKAPFIYIICTLILVTVLIIAVVALVLLMGGSADPSQDSIVDTVDELEPSAPFGGGEGEGEGGGSGEGEGTGEGAGSGEGQGSGGGNGSGEGQGSGGGNGSGGGSNSGWGNGSGEVDFSAIGGQSEPTTLLSIYADTTASVYLRSSSSGDYTGNGWAAAIPYEYLINDQYAATYLPSILLEVMGLSCNEAKIKVYDFSYVLPYFTPVDGTTYVQTSDTVYTGDTAEEYSVLFYLYDGQSISVIFDDAYEQAYRQFVYENYLTIDEETLAFMQGIITSESFSADDADIISKVASYIQQAATYNLDFDPALDQSDNVAIDFLQTYQEGVCRHYATAATLLYRALGIPARYTQGVLALTQANEWVDVSSMQAHAWVEVYIDAVGWIPVEVTGGSSGAGGSGEGGGGSEIGGGSGEGGEGGSQTAVCKELTLYPKTVYKAYDGTPLTSDGQLGGFAELAALGFTYDARISGEQTEPGISHSTIEQVTIYDSAGNDVTASFLITTEEGVIQVYAYSLHLVSCSYTKVYDGQQYAPTLEILDGALQEDHYMVVTPTVTEAVGKHVNRFEVQIFDSDGNEVTDLYLIRRSYGEVTVLTAALTLKAADATKVYDGTELTCDEWYIAEGALAQGHSIAYVTIQGSQTELGRSESRITDFMIVDAEGNDVTANYSVDLLTGVLRVTASEAP